MRTIAIAAALVLSAGPDDRVFEEKDGELAVEAEAFHEQTLAELRRWHRTDATTTPDVAPDGDPPHLEGASGGAYLEALPDTRRTHDDKLVKGENFSDEPGKMAVLSYRCRFTTPGRYYVWARIYSTGTEDNGIHAGLNGQWPASGRRMQWTAKNAWTWGSKQRTAENHGGEPGKIWLDIPAAGDHVIQFSMREDGFEFDKWLLTTRRLDRIEESSAATIEGELKQWHKVTLTLDGPSARETDTDPNPFTDYRMTATFVHESGAPAYEVPGYFAADGRAAETSAAEGRAWRAHLSPDKPGRWTWSVSFSKGRHAALDAKAPAEPLAPFHGKSGSFEVAPTDKTGPDFRGKGRLRYVGKHHLRFAGTGEYFLKLGPDAPETFLACTDFDGTTTAKQPLKTWAPHVRDWAEGDPTWKGGKGKGIVGALNYLASKGCNAFSFLPYNAGGDGDNVWPFVGREAKLHYDCSKLDQWGIVFDHAQALGLYLHFKLQETENDDLRHGKKNEPGNVPAALDGGDLGIERKLYLRELIARFGHALALNWNLGEENTQTPGQQRDMAAYLRDVDPYGHLRVIHTYPDEQDKVYPPLLGEGSALTGASLQNGWKEVHRRTLQWVTASAKAGKPWVVANDEQGSADTGVPPDPGYRGWDGKDKKGKVVQTLHDIRKHTLWGNLMAGGAGVEYYFGYALPENDLLGEDFRSRERSWDYGRLALGFFRDHAVPFWELRNENARAGGGRWCLAKEGELYLVYLPDGGEASLDLSGVEGAFRISWFDPRNGGPLRESEVRELRGGAKVSLGPPPADPSEDWLIVVRK
jgi:hypothetical protein